VAAPLPSPDGLVARHGVLAVAVLRLCCGSYGHTADKPARYIHLGICMFWGYAISASSWGSSSRAVAAAKHGPLA
jgi:hypothetical protein